MAQHAYQATGLKRLCMAGGVALNSVANGKILRQTPFEEIYIQPAAGDGGGAIGAALYAYHMVLGNHDNLSWSTPTGERNIGPARSTRS